MEIAINNGRLTYIMMESNSMFLSEKFAPSGQAHTSVHRSFLQQSTTELLTDKGPFTAAHSLELVYIQTIPIQTMILI